MRTGKLAITLYFEKRFFAKSINATKSTSIMSRKQNIDDSNIDNRDVICYEIAVNCGVQILWQKILQLFKRGNYPRYFGYRWVVDQADEIGNTIQVHLEQKVFFLNFPFFKNAYNQMQIIVKLIGDDNHSVMQLHFSIEHNDFISSKVASEQVLEKFNQKLYQVLVMGDYALDYNINYYFKRKEIVAARAALIVCACLYLIFGFGSFFSKDFLLLFGVTYFSGLVSAVWLLISIFRRQKIICCPVCRNEYKILARVKAFFCQNCSTFFLWGKKKGENEFHYVCPNCSRMIVTDYQCHNLYCPDCYIFASDVSKFGDGS